MREEVKFDMIKKRNISEKMREILNKQLNLEY